MGWLVSAVAAATAIAPAFAVAGVGVAAFTTLAVPSLRLVAQYEQEVASGSAKAAATWEKMNATQRAMASGLTGLSSEFHQLSGEIDPQILQVFESAISDVDRVLPEAVPLARAAAGAIVQMLDDIGGALSDSQAQQFFDFVAKSIGPDVHEIDVTVVALLHTLFSLVQALQPASLALLHVVAGFADLLSWVSRVAPPLDSIVVLSIALYRPLRLLQGLQLGSLFSWLPMAAQWMRDFMIATEGATAAERAQLAATLALEALEPWMWALLAIGGLTALAVATHQSSDATDQLIAKMREQDQATGYNIAGYEKLSAQLDQVAAQQRSLAGQDTGSPAMADPRMAMALRNNAGAAAQAEDKLTEASTRAAQAAANLSNNLSIVQMIFGLTRKQAEELAAKAGVTAQQLTGNGAAAQEAMRKILAYGNGMDAASHTTNALKLAVQSLTAAVGSAPRRTMDLV